MAKKKEFIPEKKLVPLSNVEKKGFEKWTPNRDLMNIIRPYRWLICGSPNSGKTTLILNHLVHCDPPFDAIFILHPRCYDAAYDDGMNPICEESTTCSGSWGGCEIPEYAGVKYIPLRTFPSEKWYERFNKPKEKVLLIVDDLDVITYAKRVQAKQRIINKTWSYVSTHHNVSIICTSQSPSTQLPAIVMQMSNIVSIYHIKDQYKIRALATKLSIPSKELVWYMMRLKGVHDFMTLDMTLGTPMPMRLGIYDEMEEYSPPPPPKKYHKNHPSQGDGKAKPELPSEFVSSDL